MLQTCELIEIDLDDGTGHLQSTRKIKVLGIWFDHQLKLGRSYKRTKKMNCANYQWT